jgi:hypothetical protein
VKAAHVRLRHSRMLFVRTYPRETDNMKTAVETIFVGKSRLYRRRWCSTRTIGPLPCSRVHASAASTS